MRLHAGIGRLICASLAAAVVLALAAGPGAAGTLSDQGWVPAEQAGKRGVQMRVLVTNHEATALRYQVRFTVEESELSVKAVPPKSADPGAGPAADPAWAPTTTVLTPGEVAAGASTVAAAWVPYETLRPGKAYRFTAELLEGARDPAALPIIIHRVEQSAGAGLLKGAAAAAALAAVANGGGDSPALGFPHGSGTMVGTHEAHRVGDEWVEHGSGVITLTGPGGAMVINYTYDSHGASAAELTATATGTGTLSRPNGTTLPVVITSATAQMKPPGARQQLGTVVTRTGASATGTYVGTIDGKVYQGVLTMTNGTQTLDLATGLGQHSFDISFKASH